MSMKNNQYLGVITYTISGFLLGCILIFLGVLLNYRSGFHGPWYEIFYYSPDFIVIVFSTLPLSLAFCFLGMRRLQLVMFNSTIKQSLTKEKTINTASDIQLKLLANVVAQVNEGIIISDGDGLVQWVNNGFVKTTGYKLDEVHGKQQGNILDGPLTDVKMAKTMATSLFTGQSVKEEILSYHKNGRTFWLSNSVKPIKNDTGEIVNFIAIINNITNRKEKEISIKRLYKQIADYKFALDHSALVLTFNLNGKVSYVNDKFCELNNLIEEDILGTDYRSISISLRDKSFLKPILDSLYASKSWKGELINRNKNGEQYWTDTTLVPLMDEEGNPYQFLAIQQDISVRKQLEIQLLANKNKLHEAMLIAKLGSWELEKDGTFELSTEFRQLFSFPLKGVISNDQILEKIHKDDFENVKQVMLSIRTSLVNEDVEFMCVIEGVLHHMVAKFYPRLNKASQYIGAFGTIQDITDTKLIALALKKSEEEKAVILNNTQTLMCVHDMQGIILDINTAAEKASGFSKSEVIGVNIKLFLSVENQLGFAEYIHAITNGETASGKLEIKTKLGIKRTWFFQNSIYLNNGNPYIIGSAIDITESENAQNAIENQQQIIRQIIDNNPNLIFLMNEQRQIVLANQTFSMYYPHNENEIPFAETLSNGRDDVFLGDLDSLYEMEDGEMIRLEGNLKNRVTGNISWFSIIHKCFKEKNGQKYILSFGMDFTGRYQVESDLMAANELVERSLKVKDQFIANMSHEIRTPLNAVVGFTDLLADTELNMEQSKYVDIVKTASANLLALINNILDLSKLESSNLTLESMPVNIIKLVSDVAKIFEPTVKLKGIEIRTHFDEMLPEIVMADQLRITQIIMNILGNAVKFTDKGTIDIDCKLVQGSDKNKEYISFSIKDTGIGVPKNKQTDIFERFTQSNINTQRLYGGTGLGLNITKSIVDLYGGTLTMESTQGKGTTFYFILPFNKYLEISHFKEVPVFNNNSILQLNTIKPVHILLAEDNLINAMLATQVLTRKGFIIEHVTNGALAIEALKKQPYDLVLMDIQMPVMNGIDASRAIRELSGVNSRIPIIAMTAHSLTGEMQNCYSAGMNGYVTKPFKPNDLCTTIIEVLKQEDNIKPNLNNLSEA